MQYTRPNSSFIIGERQKSKKIPSCQRSMSVISRKINSHNRLVGGADEEPVIEETPVKDPLSNSVQEVPDASSLLPPIPPTSPSSPAEKPLEDSALLKENSQNNEVLPGSGPCCVCIPRMSGSVGDKKVDEIIKNVHHNLEEAGKALANFGDNFEHNLKLMFVDIFGRIKQWTGIVQNKLDDCKNEIDNLRKELLARACEIDNKTRELNDLKVQLADYQNRVQLNDKLPKEDSKRSRVEDQAIVEVGKVVSDKEELEAEIAKKVVSGKEDVEAGIAKKISPAADQEDEDEEELLRKEEKKMKDTIRTNELVQTVVQEEEKTKRESELESEIIQLRKEFDKAMKEQTEYENAIQRALLRGVSSLNVEALKVLRYPPIPCYTPCVPCPATTKTVPPESVVPCPSKNTKRYTKSVMVNKVKERDMNIQNNDQIDYTTKQSYTGPCCSINRNANRKSTDNSMVFLLHQGDAKHLDAPDNVCHSIIKKIKIPPLPKFGMI